MTKNIIIFLNLVLTALVAGTMFGIWIGFNPISLSPTSYVEQQQSMVGQLNVLMPLLGLVTIVLTISSAFIQQKDKPKFALFLIAASLLIISGLVTRFGNQPINEIVMTWSIGSPPENWIEYRDKWWLLHIIRTLSALTALCIILGASLFIDKNKS